jgi:hypothetical protein
VHCPLPPHGPSNIMAGLIGLVTEPATIKPF